MSLLQQLKEHYRASGSRSLAWPLRCADEEAKGFSRNKYAMCEIWIVIV